jgi:cysteine-rich repeat protein
MTGMRNILAVGAFAVALSTGCVQDADDGPTCGDGVLDEVERCDDGNSRHSDGCNENCQIERGWSCNGTTCAPACGDGELISRVELCDPSVAMWAGYCSVDCTAIIGSCGDRVIQEAQEECDGQHGCDEHCRAGFGFVCEGTPVVCAASGLPGDRHMDDLSAEEWTTYCSWEIAAFGGPGARYYCGSDGHYDYYFTVRTIDECVTLSPETDYRECSVGDMEDWFVQSSGNECWLFSSNPPCMS